MWWLFKYTYHKDVRTAVWLLRKHSLNAHRFTQSDVLFKLQNEELLIGSGGFINLNGNEIKLTNREGRKIRREFRRAAERVRQKKDFDTRGKIHTFAVRWAIGNGHTTNEK